MRRIVLLALAAIGLALAMPPVGAEAKGCIKGAIAGGVAGHYAGHHGFLGAVSGCIAGRRTAKRRPHAQPTIPWRMSSNPMIVSFRASAGGIIPPSCDGSNSALPYPADEIGCERR
jgi:hypothetical protein